MFYSDDFHDYVLLDAGDGEKLEAWGDIIVRRPDPMAIWPRLKPEIWEKAKGIYHRSSKGGGSWEFREKLPKEWTVKYKDLTFKVSPTSFKHTGIFPEQAANWDLISDKLKGHGNARVLNLFAYSGVATTVAASCHIEETVHVDAAKGMVEWAKENRDLSGLGKEKIRYIVDDCLKFMKRENRRGRKYEGIIMDPPSYGRGPNNELFKFEEQINPLIEEGIRLLSDDALFFIVNTYTTGYSSTVVENTLRRHFEESGKKGRIEAGELGINISGTDYYLPCGFTVRWSDD